MHQTTTKFEYYFYYNATKIIKKFKLKNKIYFLIKVKLI